MSEHPTIRMAQGTVHIDPFNGAVRAEFLFVNEGKACSVPMGFPEKGRKSLSVLTGKSGFIRFQSFVDGSPAQVKREIGKIDQSPAYRIWWTKTVEFAAGQRRKIVVEYEAEPGFDTSGNAWMDYIIGTGRNWKGKIGSAKIVMDLRPLKRFSNVRFSLRPSFRFPVRAEWHLVNFEPRRDMMIGMDWFNGFLDVFINGVRIRESDQWGYGDRDTQEPNRWCVPDSFGPAPERFDKDVVLSAVAAAYWLKASLRFDERTAAVTFLAKDGAWAQVKPGDQGIWSKGHVNPIATKPFLLDGKTRVPIGAIAKALGGSVSWKGGKLLIDLPI